MRTAQTIKFTLFSLAEQGGEEIRKRNQRRVSAFLLRESLPTFSSGESRCPRGMSEWEREIRLREGEGVRRDGSGAHFEISAKPRRSLSHPFRMTAPFTQGSLARVPFGFPITANPRYKPLAADDRPYGVDWRFAHTRISAQTSGSLA